MRYFLACTALFSSLCIQPALAAVDPNFWVSIEGGRDFTVHTTQTTAVSMPDTSLPDDYVLNNNQNNWMAGIGVGYQFIRSSQFLPNLSAQWFPADRLGVFYNYYSPQQVSGVINEYQSIATYNDHFNVYSNTLWLDNQLDLVHLQSITPFIDLGIGASLNTANGYFEAPVAANDTPRDESAAFSNNNHWAFAYRVGCGLNITLPTKQPMDASILYRYTDRGAAETGNSSNYPIGALTTGHLKSNEIALALRYYF